MSARPSWFAPLASHASLPLFRNGYALVLNSGVTAALGMVFWLLAARLYPPDVVGINSALVAASTLLGTIAQMNLFYALNRFIPRAGHHAGRLVGASYLVSAGLAVLAGVVFLLGIDILSPALGFLRDNPILAGWFVAAVLLWAVFTLQDGALSGLRRAAWVPLENTAFGLAKIAALLVPAISVSAYGIFLAWTIPLIPLLIVVNALIFRLLMPSHRAHTQEPAQPIEVRRLARFVAGDSASGLVSTGVTSLLPIIVLQVVDAEAAAYFALSWAIAYALHLVSNGMATSLLVEAALDEAKLGEYSYRVIIQTACLLLLPVVGVVLLAPVLLSLFGTSYAAEGTALLRLLCVAALPGIVPTVYTAVQRTRGRTGELLLVTLAVNALALALSYVLLQIHGIIGIGMAWLATQSLAAAVLLATTFRPLWLAQLDPRLLSGLMRFPRLVRAGLYRRRQAMWLSALLPDVVSRVEGGSTWRINRMLASVGDVSVAIVGMRDGSSTAVVKLAQTPRGAGTLKREKDVLAQLSSDQRLTAWSALLPRVLASGKAGGQQFLLEQLMPSLDGRTVLARALHPDAVIAVALSVIAELHQRTATTVFVDDSLLDRWVDGPVRLLCERAAHLGETHGAVALERIRMMLHVALEGRTLCVSWIHGDLAPGNLLLTPDGRHVRGIVDWDRASPVGLPDLDVAHFLLCTQALIQGRELGDIVCRLLDDAAELGAGASPLTDRPLVLLAWLHHVTGILSKTDRYPPRSVWALRNIDNVLRKVDSTDTATREHLT